MAPHGQRWKSYFQFGRNSAGNWGNDTAATHRVPVLSMTRGAKLDVLRSDAMDGTRFHQVAYSGAKKFRPVTEHELTYTGMLLLLDTLMGTDTFGDNGGTTGAGPPYTHTWKMRQLFNSLVLECGMGDIPTTKVEQFVGAKIARATISGASHERLRLRLEWIAKDFSTNVTPTGGPLVSVATDCVMFDHLSSFNDGTGTTGNLTAFELTIDNVLSERDFASQLIDEPLAGGFAQVSLRITEEFQTRTAIDAHLALTQGAPALTFTSSTKVFTITMPKAYLEEGCEPEGDRMVQPLLWVPIGDDGSPETYLTMTMTNAQSSITA